MITFWMGLLIGVGLGALVVRIFWRPTDTSLVQAHNELAKVESAAQERIKALIEERDAANGSLSKAREDVLTLNRNLSAWEAKQPQFEKSLTQMESERNQLRLTAVNDQQTISDLSIKFATADSERKQLQKQLDDQEARFKQILGQSKTEFENLANTILEKKSEKLSEKTKENIDAVLNPLKEQITKFEKKVGDTYTDESRERFALKKEVERLIGLNEQITLDAKALTLALKGDSKTQGDWGEMILEKILEASGLREGHEYSLQKTHMNEDGDRLRPDVIINLPDAKHIIVDSKVSLTAYELHCRTEQADEKSVAINAHLKSLHKHVDDLAEKHYARIKGVHSPEFVFLFVPIEPAYLVAMQADPELSTKAWRKGVAIVTATTLLTSLKTVGHIWRLENQNKNALQIASEGAKLYDKFVGFVDEFEKIGKTFENGQTLYVSAMGKLKEGPGNVFRKMELLRELGAAPTKQIRADLVEE